MVKNIVNRNEMSTASKRHQRLFSNTYISDVAKVKLELYKQYK